MKLSIKDSRPTCNCGKPVVPIKNYYDSKGRKTHVSWRKVCWKCHDARTSEKHGLKRISQITAKRQGKTETEYKNQFHPYLKHRKDYCENVDGRLGHKCTATIVWNGQLQVDHIDGNHSNNNPENLQTLCANCHSLKTNIYRDWEDKKKEVFKYVVEVEC
jgi:5-methylcytosine-specific restriction endonuclease McrA